ncbi:hypothetical protein ABPG72_010078 [Tetrahymena utriculariae]
MQEKNSLRGYHILEHKGKGTLFQNFLVERDGRKYILKVFNRNDNDDTESKVEWILDKFQKNDGVYNNYLQKIIDVFHNLQQKYFVVEYFEEGNILEYMLNNNLSRLDLKLAVKVLSDVFRGISRLHEKRQYHMNLRLENIYFRNNMQNLAVCDYRILYIDKIINYYFANEYLPPEMIGKGTIDLKSEIWTLGVIFFVLVFGQFPFVDLQEIEEYTLKNNFNLKKLLKDKQILDLDSDPRQVPNKEFYLQIQEHYEKLNNFFSKIFEFMQAKRMSYIQLSQDPIFTIGYLQNLQKEREIYEQLGTDSFREQKRKESSEVCDDQPDDSTEESVQDKKYIYDMELEGAKKGVEFKNSSKGNISEEIDQKTIANYMNQYPKNQSIYVYNQQNQQAIENSQLEVSMLISYFDRSKLMKDNINGINQLQYYYSVHFSRHEFIMQTLEQILDSHNFKYKQKIILKYFLTKCALHFGQDSLQSEDTNQFYSDILNLWNISEHKKNQKQYLSNFVKKTKVDLLHSYLQILGVKNTQLSQSDQIEVVRTLSGSEDFKTHIKKGFRKVLSNFQTSIDKIIQEKKNLSEDTIAELKRFQLRLIICASANRCFIHDRLQDIFPQYMSEYKSYQLSSFNDWIENMNINELDQQIKNIPQHFYRNRN